MNDAVPVHPVHWHLAEGDRAEERDRRQWTEDFRCRMGIVAGGRSPHRPRVVRAEASEWPWEQFPGSWCWSCRFPGCYAGLGARYRSHGEAVRAASAHPADAYRETVEAAIEDMFPGQEVRWLSCGDWTTGPERT